MLQVVSTPANTKDSAPKTTSTSLEVFSFHLGREHHADQIVARMLPSLLDDVVDVAEHLGAGNSGVLWVDGDLLE